jgi:arsenite methyltransferase
MTEAEPIKSAVKKAYSSLAIDRTVALEQSCCETSGPNADKLLRYGYSKEELSDLPESVVVMADGCGNPTALGMIKEGETVLDLGSGGGIDVFLASKRVGQTGKVIGLDMTAEMVQRAKDNARKMGLSNVEFKLGEIEQMPISDRTVDVIMSNCVICLSPDKENVFAEMFRVLKPGGRLAIADEVAMKPFSDQERSDPEQWCSCITGAITEKEYASNLEHAGFTNVYVKRLRPSMELNPNIFSAFVSAVRPQEIASKT